MTEHEKTKAELVDEAEQAGVSSEGTKAEIQARLEEKAADDERAKTGPTHDPSAGDPQPYDASAEHREAQEKARVEQEKEAAKNTPKEAPVAKAGNFWAQARARADEEARSQAEINERVGRLREKASQSFNDSDQGAVAEQNQVAYAVAQMPSPEANEFLAKRQKAETKAGLTGQRLPDGKPSTD